MGLESWKMVVGVEVLVCVLMKNSVFFSPESVDDGTKHFHGCTSLVSELLKTKPKFLHFVNSRM